MPSAFIWPTADCQCNSNNGLVRTGPSRHRCLQVFHKEKVDRIDQRLIQTGRSTVAGRQALTVFRCTWSCLMAVTVFLKTCVQKPSAAVIYAEERRGTLGTSFGM